MMSPGVIVNTDNFHNFHSFEKKVYYQTGPQAQLMIYLKKGVPVFVTLLVSFSITKVTMAIKSLVDVILGWKSKHRSKQIK